MFIMPKIREMMRFLGRKSIVFNFSRNLFIEFFWSCVL